MLRYSFLVLLLGLSLGSIAQDYQDESIFQKITIQEEGKSLEVNITDARPDPETELTYYWFRNYQVMETQGDYSGSLLHGPFKVYSSDGVLLESGEFCEGLKCGTWIAWTDDGNRTIYNFRKGVLHGEFMEYSESQLISEGKYSNGQRHGDFLTHLPDTVIVTTYKRGVLEESDGE